MSWGTSRLEAVKESISEFSQGIENVSPISERRSAAIQTQSFSPVEAAERRKLIFSLPPVPACCPLMFRICRIRPRISASSNCSPVQKIVDFYGEYKAKYDIAQERTRVKMSPREAYEIEIHDGSEVDDIYGLLRLAAATKLQQWDEVREASGLHRIEVAGQIYLVADHERAAACQDLPDSIIVNRKVNEAEAKRIIVPFDYPRLCRKTAMAKHLGLTLPQLKELLGGWGYEHVLTDPMYPNAYTQMVIVKTALLCADRAGINARIPIRQERIRY